MRPWASVTEPLAPGDRIRPLSGEPLTEVTARFQPSRPVTAPATVALSWWPAGPRVAGPATRTPPAVAAVTVAPAPSSTAPGLTSARAGSVPRSATVTGAPAW